jgi:hypothetical protein
MKGHLMDHRVFFTDDMIETMVGHSSACAEDQNINKITMCYLSSHNALEHLYVVSSLNRHSPPDFPKTGRLHTRTTCDPDMNNPFET